MRDKVGGPGEKIGRASIASNVSGLKGGEEWILAVSFLCEQNRTGPCLSSRSKCTYSKLQYSKCVGNCQCRHRAKKAFCSHYGISSDSLPADPKLPPLRHHHHPSSSLLLHYDYLSVTFAEEPMTRSHKGGTINTAANICRHPRSTVSTQHWIFVKGQR